MEQEAEKARHELPSGPEKEAVLREFDERRAVVDGEMLLNESLDKLFVGLF